MKELLEAIKIEEFSLPAEITPEREKNIRNKLDIPENETIQGFFDDTLSKNGKEGIALTDKAIYWKTTGSTADGKNKSKACLSFENLKNYTSSVEKKMIKSIITLKNTNVSSSSILEYTIHSIINSDNYINAITEILKNLTSSSEINKTITEGIVESSSNENKSYDLIKLESYISPNGEDKDAILWYKKVFSAYNVNGIEKFAFKWSWSGLLFSSIFLFHRKAYKEAGITFIAGILLSLLIPVFGGPIFWIIMGVLCPYLLYKRYKSVEAKIESTITDTDKRIEAFKELGGVNPITKWVTATVALLIIILAIAYFF